jgi:hypothetical protein
VNLFFYFDSTGDVRAQDNAIGLYEKERRRSPALAESAVASYSLAPERLDCRSGAQS